MTVQQPTYTQPYQQQTPTNGYATAALVLGICGFILTGIPFFIGLFLGTIPNILAIVFGIIGMNRASKLGGLGKGKAVTGFVLATVSLISILFGAGTIW